MSFVLKSVLISTWCMVWYCGQQIIFWSKVLQKSEIRTVSVVKQIQTHKRFKRKLFIRTKHNMQMFSVIPSIKLQNSWNTGQENNIGQENNTETLDRKTTSLNQKQISGLALHLIVYHFHCLTVAWVSFCSFIKGIALKLVCVLS